MVGRCLFRATLQEILPEVCRLTSMSSEEDEYHLLWLEKDGQVLAHILANWRHG